MMLGTLEEDSMIFSHSMLINCQMKLPNKVVETEDLIGALKLPLPAPGS
jgi:hypothetical protein